VREEAFRCNAVHVEDTDRPSAARQASTYGVSKARATPPITEKAASPHPIAG
jgi:hypothetical protein